MSTTASTSTTQKFTYPTKISTDQFKNRKFTIYVKEVTVKNPGATSKSVIQSFISAANAANAAISNDASSIARTKASNDRSKLDTTKAVIVLPVPNSLSDSQNHTWEKHEGLIKKASGALSSFNLGDKSGDGKKTKYAKSIYNYLSTNASEVNAQVSNLAGIRKTIVSPGYFQNYTGSEPRTFTVSWDLIPESKIEADSIYEIVMKLKEYSSPTKTNMGSTLRAPYYFSIKLNNDYLNTMLSLDRVVITSIALNYSADDGMQLTYDGMPKHMRLELGLSEAELQTAEDYRTTPG